MVPHSRSFIGSNPIFTKTNSTWYFKHILITVNSNTKDFITNDYHLSNSKGRRFDSHRGQAYFSSLPGVDIHSE